MPASREHIFGRAVRDHHALAEQHDALGKRGGELGVVRGDHHRRAPSASSRIRAASASLWSAVHPAGRLVQETTARRLAGRPRPGEHDLQREALALAA